MATNHLLGSIVNMDKVVEIPSLELTPAIEKFEYSDFKKLLDELLIRLFEHPENIRIRTLELLDIPSKLFSLEQGVTTGTVITFLLKPSNFFLDLCFAVRTGNLDFFVVERSHSFSSVDSGLVELPILSTLEKPQTDKDEVSE